MRAIWKGHIRFSLVTIPIRIYSAIESKKSISFRQLHKEDNGPIGYDKKCKHCNESVKHQDIVKGYEYEPDRYVIFTDEDFAKVKLKSTKVIDIEAFVDAEEVHHTLFDSPYYAGPDGDVAVKAYALLNETLKRSGKMGIGRVVLRDRENVVLISPYKEGLLLYKLRYPDELRNVQNIPQLAEEVEADDAQLKLADTLVETMTKSFGDLELKDRYRESLQEIIDAKVAGQEIVMASEEEQPIVDIMTALKESISQAKTAMKPMKKATGKKPAVQEEQQQKTA